MHISQLKLIHNKIMWKEPYDKVAPVVFDIPNDELASKAKISLSDSYIDGLWLGDKERQKLSNRNINRELLYNSIVKFLIKTNENKIKSSSKYLLD